MAAMLKQSKVESFLRPSSIAVIGASETSPYTGRLIGNLQRHKYKGSIYPVNPKYSQVFGIQCYPSIAAIPGTVGLVVYALARERILDSLNECAAKGAKAMLIVSSGFAETQKEGYELQLKMKALAREKGISMVGPNSYGIANFVDNVIVTPDDQIEASLLGNVAVASQSGALGFCTFLHYGLDRGIRFSYVISTGNEADLELSDFAQFLLDDPNTKSICLFIEGIKDSAKLLRVARDAIAAGKPIVAFKVGRTELGSAAALTHTGSMTGSDSLYQAFFEQNGIVRAQDMEDLVEIGSFFAKSKQPKGTGIAIITSSGGLGSMCADLCGELGLDLPPLEGTKAQQVLTSMPELLTYGVMRNPADVRGQGMANISKTIQPFMVDDRYHTIVVACAHCGVGPRSQRIAEDIVKIDAQTDKLVVALWTGKKLSSESQTAYQFLQESSVPVFDSPRRCFNSIKARLEYIKTRGRVGKSEPQQEGAGGPATRRLPVGFLPFPEVRRLLEEYGIPMAKCGLAHSAEEALLVAQEAGYPVALKVDSEQIPHKTEAHAVKLGVRRPDELPVAFEEIMANAKAYRPDAKINGVLVQEMVQGGTEMIVGSASDPQFGPTVMVGLGGVFTEVLRDTSVRLSPVSRLDASDMVKELRGAKILGGFRGGAPADVDGLLDAIVNVSRMTYDYRDQIKELDINPLVVMPKGLGVKAVDVRAYAEGSP